MPLNLDFTKDLKFEDESPELELMSKSDKLAGLSDAALDEKLEAYKGHLRSLPLLKDKGKLQSHFQALELEKRKRLKSSEKPNFQTSSGFSSIHVIPTDHSTKLPIKENLNRDFTTLLENVGPISKIGCSKEESNSLGIPASAFYEEMTMLNKCSRIRQPFYNLHKPSMSGASAVESLKVYKRGDRREQRTSSHSELEQIEDDNHTTNRKELEETGFVMLKPGGATLGKRNPEKKSCGVEQHGGTLDSALILFSSDEENSSENGVKTLVSENLQHTRSRCLLQKNSDRRCDAAKIAYPSREDPDAVEILLSDLQRLKPMDFLNDVIIDFYIKYIQKNRCSNPEVNRKLHFFNTFFFKKLTEASDLQRKQKTADGFLKLRKWTKGLDIFEKSFLFIPVNDNFHWSLAIICMEAGDIKESPQIRILHLDSLAESCHSTDALIKILTRYLINEWSYKAGVAKDLMGAKLLPEDIKGKKFPVPSQQNEFDCGLFLLHYLELFVQNLPLPFSSEKVHMMFGPNWFAPAEASSLRMTIRKLIEGLFAAEQKQIKESCPLPSDHEPIITS